MARIEFVELGRRLEVGQSIRFDCASIVASVAGEAVFSAYLGFSAASCIALCTCLYASRLLVLVGGVMYEY